MPKKLKTRTYNYFVQWVRLNRWVEANEQLKLMNSSCLNYQPDLNKVEEGSLSDSPEEYLN